MGALMASEIVALACWAPLFHFAAADDYLEMETYAFVFKAACKSTPRLHF